MLSSGWSKAAQSYPGASMDDVDLDALVLSARAAVDARIAG